MQKPKLSLKLMIGDETVDIVEVSIPGASSLLGYSDESSWEERELKNSGYLLADLPKILDTARGSINFMVESLKHGLADKIETKIIDNFKSRTESAQRRKADEPNAKLRAEVTELEAKNAKYRCMLEGARELGDDIVQKLSAAGIELDVDSIEGVDEEEPDTGPQSLG